MSKVTFTEFKRNLAKEWATDEVDEASHWATREWLIEVVSEYFLEQMPNNLKDFREWYICSKGHDEEDVDYQLAGIKDENTRNKN